MSYIGNIVEIPIGLDGLSGGRNFARLSPNHLLAANNISFQAGTVQREGGSAVYNGSSLGTSIIGGWDWWPDSTTRRVVIVCADGSIRKDSGTQTFPSIPATGLITTDILPVFVEGGKEAAVNNRKLFVFTGLNSVKVLSGDAATAPAISSPPADWAGINQPTGGAVHENRLWGWGNANDPHRVYASLPTDHEDFTSTPFSLAVFPGEGEKIVAGVSYKGALILLKYPTGVYMIDTSSATSTNWRPVRITRGGGGISPACMVIVDNDVIYMDRDGNFQALSATADYGDLNSNNLSVIADFNQYMRTFITISRLNQVRGVYYPAKREAHFAVAAIGASVNNRRIVIDFNRADLPRFRVSDKDTCESIWIGKATQFGQMKLMSGDNTGTVWTLDQSTVTKGGTAYTTRFQTNHIDFSHIDPGLAGKRKLGDFLELVLERRSDATIYVDVLWDGKIVTTVPFTISTSTARWNQSFTWGHFKWASAEVIKLRKRLVGSGVRLSLIFRNSSAEDFSLIKALLYFRPADEGRMT